MIPQTRLFERLPASTLQQPPDAWIHTRSVQGTFGITAAVESFAEVIDWQEKRRGLTQGYYRLIHPPRIQHLKSRLEAAYPGYTAVFFASGGVARREWEDLCALHQLPAILQVSETLPESLSAPANLLDLQDAACEVFAGILLLRDAGLAAELHERNRRRGGALSARNAAWLLGDADATAPQPGALQEIRRRLCAMEGADSAFLYPSGMAAVTAALDLALTPETPGLVVMGNVYRDTHLLLEEMPWAACRVEAHLLDTHDLQGLEKQLQDPRVGAVFLETITNPLIEVPDLPAIAARAHAAGRQVLVDSTMATPMNCQPLRWGADVVIHSTSKYLSGSNTHGGGAVLTRSRDWADALAVSQVRLRSELSPLEAPALLEGLSSFAERMPRFQRNGAALAAALRAHPAIRSVYYGTDTPTPWLNGLGSVVSAELADDSPEAFARFFDAPLHGLIKAPSLGSDQTLFCPYVYLTYYDKTDAYLRDCRLPRHLLRFACGCEEDFAPVLAAVDDALKRSTLTS